ncbi:hypothetical protein [Paenibacillus mucilaginosus]|uniref:Uncharacterized protein n=2 Tax=Paenibacillus mucilaginosus TaxID=61624 RepID=I0BTC8_9BACL|nr:hypothetical protein [Paenibacillus mucilaginosus]AEI45637.1 hypothetical protein KNP414_07127 [Paenibacillus mucilaginosus KNP414]AFH65625.1 hypothetical protein B2K_33840 [Paenibacillus mucilaginosus K02]AFK65193.1 hypothetical protein [Paenibacillus mucilaginosus K02]MCG7215164.1 hypothetical protein [Paenibacillus mucilaginosus]WDM27039.1 hypothetical protein KCX80_32340 [Paenibacillus mucilaginosus]
MKMKKYLYSMVAATLFTATLANIPISSAQANKDTVGFIDERLSKDQKDKLKEVMKNLDPEDRENVYLFDLDGSFTANRVELIEEFKKQNKDKLDTNGKLKKNANANETQTAVKKSGVVETLAYTNPAASCVSASSGPYRKVVSSTGKSRLTANIYLPIKNSEIVINKYPNEAAHIYTGAINGNQQVDAGLMFNWGDGVAPVTATEETWAMSTLGMNYSSGTIGNFKMGQTVFMKFYVPANNQAVLNVEGYKKDNTYLSATAVYTVDPSKGFTTNGANMKVKRVTSIGQDFDADPTKHSENLTTGSYLNNVKWSNVKVGTTSGTEQLQTASTTSESCGYKTSNVLVDFVSFSQETVRVKAGTLTP